MNIGEKYDVYARNLGCIDKDLTLIAIIGAGQRLSEQQVLDYYFNGDYSKFENSKYPVSHFMRPSKVCKAVFNNMVIPMNDNFRLVASEE